MNLELCFMVLFLTASVILEQHSAGFI